MSDAPLLTLDGLCSGALAPWFSGESIAAGDRVATPKEAAARAVLAAPNSPEGAKGKVRILVVTNEDKRLVKNFLDAFLSDVPALKRMVRKVAQDGSVFLHGGVSIVIDTNEARLAKDSIATIILDERANEAIASIWRDQDETEEECAVRHGYDASQVSQLRFIRWLRPGERPASEPVKPTPDGRVEAGPPDDARHGAQDARAPDHDRLAQEQRYREAVARLERERINEKLAEGYRRMGGVA
jgi:hypothetical protein